MRFASLRRVGAGKKTVERGRAYTLTILHGGRRSGAEPWDGKFGNYVLKLWRVLVGCRTCGNRMLDAWIGERNMITR